MKDFAQRFEIIYQKYADWGCENGFKPSKLAFSRYIGVVQATMQRWEKGQLPSAKDIKTIHDKLGFAYDWLICGEGPMFDDAAKTIAEQKDKIKRLEGQLAVEREFRKESTQAVANAAEAAGQE